MVPNHALDSFFSQLMADDQAQEAIMRVALKVAAQYNGPGQPLDEKDYALAYELCERVTVN